MEIDAAFQRLSPEGRDRRFFVMTPTLSGALARDLTDSAAPSRSGS